MQGKIRKINQAHNLVLNSDKFRFDTNRRDRNLIVSNHKESVENMKPLLLKLITLNANYLNSEINADVDDFLESNDVGKRVSRRFRRGYYNALAKNYLTNCTIDPLRVCGAEANHVLKNLEKVDFSRIGEIKVGNKIFRVSPEDDVVMDDSIL